MVETVVLRDKLFDSPGYCADWSLSPAELQVLRGAIEAQYLGRIAAVHPQLVERFAAAGLENYHTLAHLVDHESLWPKEVRLLPEDAVERVAALPVMERLRDELGSFAISDVVYGDTIVTGRREVYWRIVRPGIATDVGPLHADAWFHAVLGGGDQGMFAPETETVKIWIPVACEPGRNGLMVVPDSHKRDWPHRYERKGGFLKPELEPGFAYPEGELVLTRPGTLLMFNERLLHGGAVNLGGTTRISAEITMVFD